MSAQAIQPYVADRETAPFFAAAAEGRLVYKGCDDCGRGLHPPTDHCPRCGGWNTSWREATGAGSLHSWTTVAHQTHPAFPAPYTIVLVELDDAPDVRLVGRLDGEPELTVGQSMQVWFERCGEGSVLPQWKIAEN